MVEHAHIVVAPKSAAGGSRSKRDELKLDLKQAFNSHRAVLGLTSMLLLLMHMLVLVLLMYAFIPSGYQQAATALNILTK